MEKNFIPNSKIYNKDSRDMSEIKDSSINLIVTSPPYGNLKDYKVNNQIGQGSGYKEYLKELAKVWDECIRVLSPDGKLCINIMPLFESGNDTKFKRRVTRLVINDLINYIEGTEKCFYYLFYLG